ncbi:biotin transporter BioY [Halocella sp. SP3-1]|uniref:biotin transporter BioY n=1 Tax=Halocella sp. SP3-1 TaxID=2382161 RepID=UPI000F75FF08|nr:biotin transporter BioY [Halocella sp. SP3-1]AZO94827.1 biotin transporter BioY [Halocella sp. SP3-1]
MKTKEMVLVAIFAALTAIGAFIRIPLPSVPITLQVFFVFMAGLILGKKLAALSQLLYVFIGLIGIPIFTEGGGPGYILKPSFGYLLGFIAGAYVIGMLTENGELNFKRSIIAGLAGIIVIYTIGVPYLYIILNYVVGASITINKTLQIGLFTSLPGDIIKLLIVSLIAPKIYRSLQNY